MSTRVVASILAVALLVVGCSSGDGSDSGQSEPIAQPLVDGTSLDPGTYSLSLQPGLSVTFDVGAGWTSWAFGAQPTDGGAEPPAGKAFGFWIIDTIYGDVCRWRSAPPKPAGQSAASIAQALAAQRGRESVSEPTALEVDGYPALQIDLTLSQQLDLATCDNDEARSWTQNPVGVRYHQWAGQINRVILIDVGPADDTGSDSTSDPAVVVINTLWYPETSAAARAELDAVAASVQIVDNR